MKAVRHISFWLVYCTYFYIQSISPWSVKEFYDPVTYRNAFVSMYSFVPVCILSVYVSLYYILPRFIERKNYQGAIIAFIVLFSAGTYINYHAAHLYFYQSGIKISLVKGPLSLGYLNTIWAMIISGFAICIKITKKWFLQRAEIEMITRQKTRNELNLQKNKMHPGFLYSSLDSIYAGLRENKASSSSMILVLSNLLSYSLYESKTERVSLQNELNAVSEFITLEKMKGSNDIALNVDESINAEEIMVPPMVVLSVLQDGCTKSLVLIRKDDELVMKAEFTDRPSVTSRIKTFYREVYEPA